MRKTQSYPQYLNIVWSFIVYVLKFPLTKYKLLFSLQLVLTLFKSTLTTYDTCSILTSIDKYQTGLLDLKNLILLWSNNTKFHSPAPNLYLTR